MNFGQYDDYAGRYSDDYGEDYEVTTLRSTDNSDYAEGDNDEGSGSDDGE